MLLLADKLTLARGPRVLIRDLSFSAGPGKALIVTGPNGAGKTTLLRALAGFLRPEAGRIELKGGDPERTLGEQCHYVGHQTSLKGNLSAYENLAFWARYLSAEKPRSSLPAEINGALSRLKLAHIADSPAGYLSAGQKRRLCLARLLVAARPVWLLDEPTVSLDAASTALLTEIFREHLAGGGLLVAATHVPLGLEGAEVLSIGTGGETS